MVGGRRECRPPVRARGHQADAQGGGPEGRRQRGSLTGQDHFRSGLALDVPRKVLYSLDIDHGTIAALDPEDRKEIKSAPAGAGPTTSRSLVTATISSSPTGPVGGSSSSTRPTCGRRPGFAVGEHPNQLAVHPKDDRLFVACASSNCVSVIDTRRGIVTETIHTALFPKAPEGSTPDALAIAPDGKTLFVANADNNCVAVIDISVAGPQPGQGLHPHRLVSDGRRGHARRQEPPRRRRQGQPDQGQPDQRRRGEAQDRVRAGRQAEGPAVPLHRHDALGLAFDRASPGRQDAGRLHRDGLQELPLLGQAADRRPASREDGHPDEGRRSVADQACPLHHQGESDLRSGFRRPAAGQRRPALVMFGRDVTPNHHKLAEEFVLLDNLYCNGHVSADGHPWSTMAYNTDYIARNWALTYSSRTGDRRRRAGRPVQRPLGLSLGRLRRAGPDLPQLRRIRPARQPARWLAPDRRRRAGAGRPHVPRLRHLQRSRPAAAATPTTPTPSSRNSSDSRRTGPCRGFMVMSLGEDHTTGTRPGTFTPQACVASNDLALGRIVEAVTHSKSWPETAIFVIEDDAQNGPDHVDAHRTVGLVISPYTKRKHLDSTQYSTVSMIRTIELILGLSPLSQYDAAARPMFASFTDKADLTPYTLEPARIDLNAVNAPTAYGAERSMKMDFDEYDRIDDFELNEILWRAIKGKDAPVPPAVRRAIAFRPTAQPIRP